MKKIRKRLRPLLLLIMFTAVSCQEDPIEYNSASGEPNGNSRIISLEELKSARPKAYEQIKQYIKPQQLHSRTVYNDEHGISINTDAILLYEDDKLESLTFMIVRDTVRDYLENLILNKETDREYNVYYTAYDLDEQKQEALGMGEDVNVDKVYFSALRREFGTNLFAKGGTESEGEQIIRRNGKCYRSHVVRINSWTHSSGQLDFSEFVVVELEIECPPEEQPDEGGWWGGIPPSDYTPPYVGIPSNTPPPGGPGNGAIPRNPVITRPFIDISIHVECYKIINLMNRGTYKQDLQQLATLVNDPINEHGIGLALNDSTMTLTPGREVGVPFGYYSAISHTHNQHLNAQGQYDGGTYSIFSYEDLVGFADLIQQNKIPYPESFVATLSTKKGTHYVMTINNIAKFKDFFYHRFNTFGTLDAQKTIIYGQKVRRVDEISHKYFDTITGIIKRQNTNNQFVLESFLSFLNEADMGITLFETDATFENYTRVSRKGMKPIKREPCR